MNHFDIGFENDLYKVIDKIKNTRYSIFFIKGENKIAKFPEDSWLHEMRLRDYIMNGGTSFLPWGQIIENGKILYK